MNRTRVIVPVALLLAALSAGAQVKIPNVQLPVFRKDTFNILQYGAKSDGVTLNTKSINNAIIACMQKGGGVVMIPAGFWLTGPIELKSNVQLHLQKAALLQFTDDKAQ